MNYFLHLKVSAQSLLSLVIQKDVVSNIKPKYAISKLDSFYSNTEIFAVDGSIEHTIPETEEENSLNIGNLIMLEKRLNEEAGNKEYLEKRVIYIKSNYLWIKNFAE